MLWGVLYAMRLERGLTLPVCFCSCSDSGNLEDKYTAMKSNDILRCCGVCGCCKCCVNRCKCCENVVLVHHLYVVIEQCMVLVFLLQRYYYQHSQHFLKVSIHVQVQI